MNVQTFLVRVIELLHFLIRMDEHTGPNDRKALFFFFKMFAGINLAGK